MHLMSISIEDVLEMIDNVHTSTNAVSDYDSSAVKCSELDLSNEDKSTDFSETCSPIMPLEPLDIIEEMETIIHRILDTTSDPDQELKEMIEVILFHLLKGHATHLW